MVPYYYAKTALLNALFENLFKISGERLNEIAVFCPRGKGITIHSIFLETNAADNEEIFIVKNRPLSRVSMRFVFSSGTNDYFCPVLI
jgi:hypothetical protein